MGCEKPDHRRQEIGDQGRGERAVVWTFQKKKKSYFIPKEPREQEMGREALTSRWRGMESRTSHSLCRVDTDCIVQ